MGVSEGGSRLLLRLGVGAAGLAGLSGTASAHGPHGTGGESVAFAVVLGLPIAAGLGGGVLATRGLRVARTAPTGHRLGAVLGVSLAVLGATFAVSAVTTSRPLGLAGGAVGAISALLATRVGVASHEACHADLTLGAVSAHRLLEGLALGALYSAGAAVGLLGAVLLAGHTALETAAVGGMYATSDVRTRAVGAILLVQAGYAVGAVIGLGVAGALPTSVRALALAVAGGALLVVGAGETERSMAAGRPATA
ncbi:MAG TPA: hypothetical protein VKA37_09405 [Halobacteriales archaeon]|nr:hypothetical protein [Halobacteriales archaeon]